MPVAAKSLANLRTTGRPSGFPNKFNRDIRDMIERALHKAGGVEYLTAQAHANPVAFLGLVGKVLPMQLSQSDADGNPVILHLVAAQTISLELQRTPAPTINAEPVQEIPDNLLDAPPASE